MEYMYPMDFEEFLMATSSHGLIDEIYKCYNSSIPMTSTLHEKLMGLYRMYLCVGGMPQAVEMYSKIRDFEKVDRIKRNLKIDIVDVVEYCKNKVLDENCHIYKQGKNWYCEIGNVKITINSYSYTIITAHIIK